MKKITKIINLTLVLIILLSTILPALSGISNVIAATYTIKYNGSITYGPSTVRRFFCKWFTSILYGT